MPRELFGELARGGGGADAVRELRAAQHSKHLFLIRGVREAALPGDRFALPGYQLLDEVRRHAPAAFEAVITYPSVGAWALRTLRRDQEVPGAVPAGLSVVAAAAAIRAGFSGQIEVPVTNGRVMLPSLGAAEAKGPTAVVRTSPPEVCSAGLRVAAVDRDAPGWLGLREIQAGSLRVLLDDLDPFRMPAAQDLASRLSATEVAELTAVLREAWPVLGPVAADEIATAVRVIVPYVTPPAGHVSSSSPETFGTVAMSAQPDLYTCAATLVHETQHLKLSALLDLVTLTLPDNGQRFYAPWRTDPRPVSSLLQGAYAFLGVTGFWRRQRQSGGDAAVRQRADAEFARWRDAVAEVVRTLQASGRLTQAGADFTGELAHVLDGWLREPVPAQALAAARHEAELHRARWQLEDESAPG
jgi:HEXXH motif-containing protein